MRKLSVNRKPLRNCASLAYRPAFGNAKGLIRLIAGLALRARVGQRQRLRKRPATILASMAARGELPVLFFGCWVSLARIPSHSSVSEAMTWQLPVINLRTGLAGANHHARRRTAEAHTYGTRRRQGVGILEKKWFRKAAARFWLISNLFLVRCKSIVRKT